MCKKQPYYITTAIAYTSQKPHIGNSYEIVLTDAIARYKRMLGYDVFFMTGTDEHGQKIEESAKEAGLPPKKYVDNVANQVKGICNMFNTTYDHFVRTTDDSHVKAVQAAFKKLYDQGDIYKSTYEGMYCTPCESFWTKSQLKDGMCPDCGREVSFEKEESYFLKLSNYQKQLEDHIENTPDFILPESRKREMYNNFIKPGLQDLCVSRTSFKWGIPVTFDDGHVIYVWLDALLNYATGLGYNPNGSGPLYKKYWPADVHIIGKDILRFHSIYWPIILMALGEPLPKQIFAHPWFLFGEDKMSKSRGNVMYADDLINLFGVDAIRYYVLAEMPYLNDGTITYKAIIEKYNSDLANTLGNLVNRTIAMNNKYFDGIVQNNNKTEDIDNELKTFALDTVKKVDNLITNYKIADGANAIIAFAHRCNKYIDETTPWILAKNEEDKERLGTVLYNLLESIRFLAILLSPYMPETSENILNQINCNISDYESLSAFGKLKAGTKLNTPTPLFNRLDVDKKLKEIEEKLNLKNQDNESKAKSKDKKDEPVGLAQINIDDFFKVELKVAKVINAVEVKKSNKLLKLTLNDGNKNRTVVSGIAENYKPDDLIGRKVVLVANLKPATIFKIESNGMILAGTSKGKIQVVFVDDMEIGSKIS